MKLKAEFLVLKENIIRSKETRRYRESLSLWQRKSAQFNLDRDSQVETI